jgi:hypothetical protein
MTKEVPGHIQRHRVGRASAALPEWAAVKFSDAQAAAMRPVGIEMLNKRGVCGMHLKIIADAARARARSLMRCRRPTREARIKGNQAHSERADAPRGQRHPATAPVPHGPPARETARVTHPDVVRLAEALARKKPKGGKLSLRAISTQLAARGVLNERGKPFNPKSVSVLLAS